MPKLIKNGQIIKNFGYDQRGIALCNQAARAQGAICQMESNNPEQSPNPNNTNSIYPAPRGRMGPQQTKPRGY